MAEVTLKDAVRVLDERKSTWRPDSGESVASVFGLDINVFELEQLGEDVGVYATGQTGAIPVAAKSAWMDGVLTGLMLAELRQL